jgi:hypothetical protein
MYNNLNIHNLTVTRTNQHKNSEFSNALLSGYFFAPQCLSLSVH